MALIQKHINKHCTKRILFLDYFGGILISRKTIPLGSDGDYRFYTGGFISNFKEKYRNIKSKHIILDKGEFKNLRMSFHTAIPPEGRVTVCFQIYNTKNDIKSPFSIVIQLVHDMYVLSELFEKLDTLGVLEVGNIIESFENDMYCLQYSVDKPENYKDDILNVYKTLYYSVSDETRLKIELNGGVPWGGFNE